MPELTANGDIFNLQAGAGFDEGYVSADVGAGARTSFGASAEFCHGINLAVDVDAAASAFARLKLLWFLVGKAEGQALAAAGAEAKVKVDVNLFETAGLSASLQAYAEASVAGRLSVMLSLEDIVKIARDRLNNIEYDIFIAFLNELSGGAGVWGKLSAAAMAKAYIEIICSLKDDDDSGFILDAGVEAGLGVGGGYGFYAGFRFKNPKRFFLYTSERITKEIVSAAKKSLPSNISFTTEFMELLLPVSLNTAYELGQRTALSFDDPEIFIEVFNDCFKAQAQRYSLDKLTDYGLNVLNNLIKDSLVQIASNRLSMIERQRLIGILDAVIDFLKKGELHSNNINQYFINPLTDILEALIPDQRSKWRSAISITWFALASVEAIRYGFVTASASASAEFLGLKTPPASTQVISLYDPPSIVVEEFRNEFGHVPLRFTFGDAVEYLIHHSGAINSISNIMPETNNLINTISATTGIGKADVINFFLDASFGKDLSNTGLYKKLRDFTKQGIEDYILNVLIPGLRHRASGNEDFLLYIDKVIKPSFLITRNFVFGRLDKIVSGRSPSDPLLYSKTFSTALSNLVFKIFKENIIVLFEITYGHVLDSLHSAFGNMADILKNSPNNVLINAVMQHIIKPILPPFVSLSGIEEPARKLAFNLCNAASVSFGPAVISHQRRSELFSVISKVLYSIDSTEDILKYPDAIEDTFKDLCECSYIPDVKGLEDLFNWNADTLAKYTETSAPLIADALGIFMIEITYKPVKQLEDAAKEFVIALLELVRDLWEQYLKLLDEFEKAVQIAQQKAREASDALKAAAAMLKKKSTRDLVLDDLRAAGVAEAKRIARSVPGFDFLNNNDKQNALIIAEAAFNTAFAIARPLLVECLKALSEIADDFGNILSSAADFPDLVKNIVDDLTGNITGIIRNSGIPLPSEIGLNEIIDALEERIRNYSPISDLLRTALELALSDQAAREKKIKSEEDKDKAFLKHKNKLKEQEDIVGTNINIQIESPLPFFSQGNGKTLDWMYGRDLPVWITIYGGRISFVDPETPQRVFVAVNGIEVKIPYSKWSYDRSKKALVLRDIFTSHSCTFKSGINVIECSVVSGAEPKPKRSKTAFIMNLDLNSGLNIKVDLKLSVFNAPSNDHVTVKKECVVIRNTGKKPISFRGYRLMDLKKHTYNFPGITLKPVNKLFIHTGAGINRSGKTFWGRKSAVWNNSSDFVFLIDNNNVLSYPFLYIADEKNK